MSEDYKVILPPSGAPSPRLSSPPVSRFAQIPVFHPAVQVKHLFDLFHPIPGSCDSHSAEDDESWDKISGSDGTQTRGAGCSLPELGVKRQLSKYPGALGAPELAKGASSLDPHLHCSAHRCCPLTFWREGEGWLEQSLIAHSALCLTSSWCLWVAQAGDLHGPHVLLLRVSMTGTSPALGKCEEDRGLGAGWGGRGEHKAQHPLPSTTQAERLPAPRFVLPWRTVGTSVVGEQPAAA